MINISANKPPPLATYVQFAMRPKLRILWPHWPHLSRIVDLQKWQIHHTSFLARLHVYCFIHVHFLCVDVLDWFSCSTQQRNLNVWIFIFSLVNLTDSDPMQMRSAQGVYLAVEEKKNILNLNIWKFVFWNFLKTELESP